MTTMPRAHGPEWVHPEVYREARKAGYTPEVAAYLGRDPVVRLECDADPGPFYDAGTFVYRDRTFTYRIEWDADCLCRESDSMEAEDYDRYDHRGVIVSLGEAEESLWSVCGDRRTWLARLSDDRHVAEVARDLADELLNTDA